MFTPAPFTKPAIIDVFAAVHIGNEDVLNTLVGLCLRLFYRNAHSCHDQDNA